MFMLYYSVLSYFLVVLGAFTASAVVVNDDDDGDADILLDHLQRVAETDA